MRRSAPSSAHPCRMSTPAMPHMNRLRSRSARSDTEEDSAHPSILPPGSMAISVSGGDRVRCVWVVVPGIVAGGHLPSRATTEAHGHASPAGHDQADRGAGGARGSDEEGGTNGAGSSDDEHRR